MCSLLLLIDNNKNSLLKIHHCSHWNCFVYNQHRGKIMTQVASPRAVAEESFDQYISGLQPSEQWCVMSGKLKDTSENIDKLKDLIGKVSSSKGLLSKQVQTFIEVQKSVTKISESVLNLSEAQIQALLKVEGLFNKSPNIIENFHSSWTRCVIKHNTVEKRAPQQKSPEQEKMDRRNNRKRKLKEKDASLLKEIRQQRKLKEKDAKRLKEIRQLVKQEEQARRAKEISFSAKGMPASHVEKLSRIVDEVSAGRSQMISDLIKEEIASRTKEA